MERILQDDVVQQRGEKEFFEDLIKLFGDNTQLSIINKYNLNNLPQEMAWESHQILYSFSSNFFSSSRRFCRCLREVGPPASPENEEDSACASTGNDPLLEEDDDLEENWLEDLERLKSNLRNQIKRKSREVSELKKKLRLLEQL